MSRSSRSSEPLIYSCTSPVARVGIDTELGYPASIGIEIHKQRFGGLEIFLSHPKLSSLEEGESTELESSLLEEYLQSLLSRMASDCRVLAANLISHAERLEKESRRDFSFVATVASPQKDTPTVAASTAASTLENRAKEKRPSEESSPPSSRPVRTVSIDLFT